MVARSRSRQAHATYLLGRAETWYNNAPVIGVDHVRHLQNAWYSQDQTNQTWTFFDNESSSYPLRGRFDCGGVFDLTSVVHQIPGVGTGTGQTPSSGIWKKYDGPLSAGFPTHVSDHQSVAMNASQILANIPGSIDSVDTRFALGGTAISRCSPARPEAALTTSIWELVHDGIPSILSRTVLARDKLERFRGLGGDYLNVEFGWKPFVNDLRQTLQAISNQERILEDLTKHSGQRMRRRYMFEPETWTETVSDQYKPWPLGNDELLFQAERIGTKTYTKKTWFSGEFVYRVPPLSGVGGVAVKARHLLGLDLTPSTIWNSAPWTWLADWYGNTGDVLANISAMSADDLVMRYGYLMQMTEMKVTSQHRGVVTRGYGSVPSTIEGSVTFSRKTRVPASAFGFGLTTSDFTPRQWAVLGALGISRGR